MFRLNRVALQVPMFFYAIALEFAWAITRRGGQTITAGLPHLDARLSIPAVQVVGEERALRGNHCAQPPSLHSAVSSRHQSIH